jgi:Amt family ammonium transporter
MIPGLGFFEIGLLPSNSTASVLSQIMALLPILGFMWIVFGYSLSFGEDINDTSGLHAFIGNFHNIFWRNVSTTSCSKFANEIPGQIFALFQMMFSVITPLLMTGAFAGRMKFTAAVLFTILWEVLVYYPCCYWLWGGGWLARLGAVDFAGGIVIHCTAGTGALMASWWVGKRPEFIKYVLNNGKEVPPSNIAIACVGVALLWTGWFGFNGGSSLSVSPVSVTAIVNTQAAAVVSGLVWISLSWYLEGYTSLVPAINGSIAGLAGVTPAAGYVAIGSAMAIGLVVGVICFVGVGVLKRMAQIDDALDVSVVHGLAGVIGSLAVGICASKSINKGIMYNGVVFGGSWHLLGLQALAVTVVVTWTAVWSAIILFALQKTVGITHPCSNTCGADPANASLPVNLDHKDHRFSHAYRIERRRNKGRGRSSMIVRPAGARNALPVSPLAAPASAPTPPAAAPAPAPAPASASASAPAPAPAPAIAAAATATATATAATATTAAVSHPKIVACTNGPSSLALALALRPASQPTKPQSS